MRSSRDIHALLVLLLAALVTLACGGSEPPELNEEQRREWMELRRLQDELGRERARLATQRTRLAGGGGTEDARREPLGAGERAALERAVAERQRRVSALSQSYGSRLVAFIDSFGPRETGPSAPERRGAIRMKSDEDMAVAAEWIERGGDYRRAIEIYETQRGLDPGYEALAAALRRAREMRRVSAARFAGVERGMTQAQVRAVLGPVNLRLVRSYPERGIEAWLYPQDQGGTAAVYFRRDAADEPLVVYETVFELPPSEAPAAGAAGPRGAPRTEG